MPPWTGSMYELSEQEITQALQAGHNTLHSVAHCVVLSHCPPYDCQLDCVRSGGHVGSRSVREFIEQTNPQLVICGHIHEARGIDRIGETTVVNCGPAFTGCYAVATLEAGIDIQLKRV